MPLAWLLVMLNPGKSLIAGSPPGYFPVSCADVLAFKGKLLIHKGMSHRVLCFPARIDLNLWIPKPHRRGEHKSPPALLPAS